MENLEIYEKYRSVPSEAQTPITGGRLKGFTDINPMWRIKSLTEQFGACGIGWYYEIKSKWCEDLYESKMSNELSVWVEINLYIKVDGEWSKPISGIGGCKLLALEHGSAHLDDEAYKKATTDALSVACKNLGFGADVYWSKASEDKYETASTRNSNASTGKASASTGDDDQEQETKRRAYWRGEIEKYAKEHGMTVTEITRDYNLNGKSTSKRLMEVVSDLKGESTSNTNGEQIPHEDDFASIDEDVPF